MTKAILQLALRNGGPPMPAQKSFVFNEAPHWQSWQQEWAPLQSDRFGQTSVWASRAFKRVTRAAGLGARLSQGYFFPPDIGFLDHFKALKTKERRAPTLKTSEGVVRCLETCHSALSFQTLAPSKQTVPALSHNTVGCWRGEGLRLFLSSPQLSGVWTRYQEPPPGLLLLTNITLRASLARSTHRTQRTLQMGGVSLHILQRAKRWHRPGKGLAQCHMAELGIQPRALPITLPSPTALYKITRRRIY